MLPCCFLSLHIGLHLNINLTKIINRHVINRLTRALKPRRPNAEWRARVAEMVVGNHLPAIRLKNLLRGPALRTGTQMSDRVRLCHIRAWEFRHRNLTLAGFVAAIIIAPSILKNAHKRRTRDSNIDKARPRNGVFVFTRQFRNNLIRNIAWRFSRLFRQAHRHITRIIARDFRRHL